MYAVIETGGKQYRVELGSEIEVERLEGDAGQTVEFDRVLLVAGDGDAAIGRPVVEGARVSASVVRQDRGEKIVVFKYRPKARHRVKQGHRQELTRVRVSDIVHGGKSAAREADEGRAERERAQSAAAEQAARQAAADRALAERLAREGDSEKPTDDAAPTGRRARPRAGESAGGATGRVRAKDEGRPTRSAGGRPAGRTQAPQPDKPDKKESEAPQAKPRRTRSKKDE